MKNNKLAHVLIAAWLLGVGGAYLAGVVFPRILQKL